MYFFHDKIFQNTVHNRVPIPLSFLIQFRHMDANHRQRPPRDSIHYYSTLPALLHKETDLREAEKRRLFLVA